ncbi:hypothetical protein [Simonsiella muelleri]|nr:hypothetical protein [Simonsiella muelleri]
MILSLSFFEIIPFFNQLENSGCLKNGILGQFGAWDAPYAY